MPSLKDLRVRINSVKSTRKITSAMKMVAAAKLRRAQEQAEAARPFAERMERMLASLAGALSSPTDAPAMLAGTGSDRVQLLIVATADRGLCGAFNSSIVREARRQIRALLADGKTVKILCVGRKGRDLLRREFGSMIVDTITDFARPRLSYDTAARIAERVSAMFFAGEFDVAKIVYNRFRSAITQIVTVQQLIPFSPPAAAAGGQAAGGQATGGQASGGPQALYEYEPDEEQILDGLLPRNLAVQIYRALLENNASEHGARMTAMDNATRNASDMIGKLTLVYNRSRQAAITKELIEIISGAEAL
ncbi:ATP synthase gamma chain [Allostella sp. ATCC 35155]|nr:ATP synthase gamma chain [Stella sp. ATCC 35155]